MYYLNGGIGQLEALRKPIFVNKATYDRARAHLAFQPMVDRINLTKRYVWARTKTGLDVPYWNVPGFKDKDPLAPKSGLVYQPYWMTNRSRARLIQRPQLWVKPQSEVLYHLGTDEADGLGKGGIIGKITKPIKKVAKIAVKALPDIATGGLYSIAKAGINVAKGKQSILGGIKSAIVRQGPAGALLTAAVGENKSLAIQGAVAGGALTAAGVAAASGATGLAAKALPTALSVLPSSTPPLPPLPTDPYASSSGQLIPPWYQGAPGYAPPVAEAGMFGGLSPVMIGAMIGIPLIVQLLLKNMERK